MKVDMFVKLYNAKTQHILRLTKDDIKNVITDLIHPIDYVPYDSKIQMVECTINQCKDCKYPTVEMKRWFIVNLISLYTDLDVTITDFDTLSKNKLIDIILSMIQSEYVICENIMYMCLDDMKGW